MRQELCFHGRKSVVIAVIKVKGDVVDVEEQELNVEDDSCQHATARSAEAEGLPSPTYAKAVQSYSHWLCRAQ